MWRPAVSPKAGAAAGAPAFASSLSTAPWAEPVRAMPRQSASRRTSRQLPLCANYAMLRPRRRLQAAMLPALGELSRFEFPVGVHLRTGYADWSYLNTRRHRSGATVADASASAAAVAPRMSLPAQWRTFESALLDCTDPAWRGGPCFNWRNRQHRSPTLADATRDCGDGEPPALRAPSNGTLAAAFGCAAVYGERFAERLGAADRRAARSSNSGSGSNSGGGSGGGSRGGSDGSWGLLVLGDSPALPSLARALPLFARRVVDTAAIGPIGHTSRTMLCDASGGGRCAEEGAADPLGAWTRAMVDFYLGGLTSAFVSALFSSWQAAMLSRSLLCCKRRMHFGAMYSQANSHRDKPMPNVTFLQAVTQTAVRGEVEGGGA